MVQKNDNNRDVWKDLAPYLIPTLLVLNLILLILVASFLVFRPIHQSSKGWTVPVEPFSPPLVASSPAAHSPSVPSASLATLTTPATPAENRTSDVKPVAADPPSTEITTEPTAGDAPSLDSRSDSGSRPILDQERAIFSASEGIRSQFEAPKFRKRLPTHYKEIGVTESQKEEIYRIQSEYFPIISSLQRRIDRMAEERDDAVYQVLTDDQKALLAEIQSTKKKGK